MTAAAVLERFLRYVRIDTASNPHAAATPSTEGQWTLARMLAGELQAAGISDVTLTEHCYLIARLPASSAVYGGTTGFVAHLDVSCDVCAAGVRPLVEKDAAGRTIIKTDGSTLLGADDKAGIAAIMSAAVYLAGRPDIPHGELEFIFTPDEETGRSLAFFPREAVRSSLCYTVDGGGEGEVEIECFNALTATVYCRGKAIHPGYARGLLVNAALMASVYAAMLPRNESPEATDGRYGYYMPRFIQGGGEEARLEVLVRDFEQDGLRRRMDALECFARAVEAQFPGGTVRVESGMGYRNMRESIEKNPAILKTLTEAVSAAGAVLRIKPVRGGTDGARLCEAGIPAPNIWTGGYLFHSCQEYAVLEEITSASRLIVELAAQSA